MIITQDEDDEEDDITPKLNLEESLKSHQKLHRYERFEKSLNSKTESPGKQRTPKQDPNV